MYFKKSWIAIAAFEVQCTSVCDLFFNEFEIQLMAAGDCVSIREKCMSIDFMMIQTSYPAACKNMYGKGIGEKNMRANIFLTANKPGQYFISCCCETWANWLELRSQLAKLICLRGFSDFQSRHGFKAMLHHYHYSSSKTINKKLVSIHDGVVFIWRLWGRQSGVDFTH